MHVEASPVFCDMVWSVPSVVALFDNEEVGSDSLMGAGSTLLEEVMKRVSKSSEAFSVACRNSFLVSADMAHSIHPNYAAKHEDKHAPKMNKGVVVKTNANQRYATSAVSSFLLKQVAACAGVPLQVGDGWYVPSLCECVRLEWFPGVRHPPRLCVWVNHWPHPFHVFGHANRGHWHSTAQHALHP
jgi:Aminopeptidase I zinc metalloprotease (M18)